MDIPLSSEEQKVLLQLHRNTKAKKTADRIKALILLNKGYSQQEIASILMLDADTITNWIKKFKSSTSIKIWLDDNYLPYQGKLNSEQRSQLKTYLTENIILNAQQVISYVKEQFGTSYSLSGMKDLLHSLGFSYKQLTLFPSKADIEKQKQFVLEFEQLNQTLGEDEEIVFIDGVHPQHNTTSSKAWIPTGTEQYLPTNIPDGCDSILMALIIRIIRMLLLEKIPVSMHSQPSNFLNNYSKNMLIKMVSMPLLIMPNIIEAN